MIRKRTDLPGAGLPFPQCPGGQPVGIVVQGCSSAGFSAPEPSQSNLAETCSVSHRWVVFTVGAAAPAPVKTSKSLEWFYREELHQDHITS